MSYTTTLQQPFQELTVDEYRRAVAELGYQTDHVKDISYQGVFYGGRDAPCTHKFLVYFYPSPTVLRNYCEWVAFRASVTGKVKCGVQRYDFLLEEDLG